jgi:hypothetical protein
VSAFEPGRTTAKPRRDQHCRDPRRETHCSVRQRRWVGAERASAAIQTAEGASNQRGVLNLPAWMTTRVEAPIGHIAAAMDEAQIGGTATTGTAHASEGRCR